MKKILKEFKEIGHREDKPQVRLYLIGFEETPAGKFTLVNHAEREDLIEADSAYYLESLMDEGMHEWVLTKPPEARIDRTQQID